MKKLDIFQEKKLLFEGRLYSFDEIQEQCELLPKKLQEELQKNSQGKDNQAFEDLDFKAQLFRFVAEFFDEKDYVLAQSSGSTGEPKIIQIEKARMVSSARLTCNFLGLKANDKALLCMPLEFIGAKMLVVRALTFGLDLYCTAPKVYALENIPEDIDFDFVAMTPQQAFACLASEDINKGASEGAGEDTNKGEGRLRAIKHLLLGGTGLSESLETQLKDFPHAVWATFGMTETLSHIALRKVNGADASEWFSPFQSVKLSLTKDEALKIEAPELCKEPVITKDRVELLPDGRFRFLGRLDNVINSGGIKIQTELVEAHLQKYLTQDFFISAAPDDALGEQVVLLLDRPCENLDEIFSALPNMYWKPRRVVIVPNLPRTDSGKPNRVAARLLAKNKA